MNIKESAKARFEEKKTELLKDFKSDNSPVAVLLGGQPASGKSCLFDTIERDYQEKEFLFINGDTYRDYCKDIKSLSRDNYSSETQIYSNVFTEEIIKEAIQRKLNFVVEGTMRDPKVPIKTIKLLKGNFYKVDVYVIAANPLISELGIYKRYKEQLDRTGFGRLADIESHDKACAGLLESLDAIYSSKSVENIKIFSFRAEKLIKEIKLIKGSWDSSDEPSFYIREERSKQFKNITEQIKLAEVLLNSIENDLKGKVLDVLVRILNS